MTATGPRPRRRRAGRDLSRFAAVDAWVFDLDNTLYPAPHQSLRAGRPAHPRLRPAAPQGRRRGGAPGAEGLLPALRHDAPRPDGGARHRAGRFPRICPRHRPFAGRARPGARRRHRAAARPEVHPHQRLAARTPRRSPSASASPTTSRTSSTSSAPSSCRSRTARPTTASSRRPASSPSRAAMFEDLSRNLDVPVGARHEDGAGRARRGIREVLRGGLGDGGPRRAARRLPHRRSRRLSRRRAGGDRGRGNDLRFARNHRRGRGL